MIAYRHCAPRYPFLWESRRQPEARWHDEGEGPVHYLADTPDGAWAELIRHEEITDPADLAEIERALWAVEIPDPPITRPSLPESELLGPQSSYPVCRAEARRLRGSGAAGLLAPSAALLPREARGHRVEGGLQPGPDREGQVVVLFGLRPDLVGWLTTANGRPSPDLLGRVRHF